MSTLGRLPRTTSGMLKVAKATIGDSEWEVSLPGFDNGAEAMSLQSNIKVCYGSERTPIR